jgi:minor extracellular serine protease Vpr
MKYFLSITFSFVFFFHAVTDLFGQAAVSNQTKFFLSDVKKTDLDLRSGEALPEDIIQSYGIQQKDGKLFAGALIMVEKGFNEYLLESQGIRINSKIGNIWSVRFTIDKIEALIAIDGVKYVDLGITVDPFLEIERRAIRADSVHEGWGIPRPYTGKNVIVAVIDWGFDYTHPVFYDSSLTHYRVVKAWDQNKIDGNPPSGYSYGAEYSGKDDLLAAKHDTDYVFGPGSHGTHVAGIAGGSGGNTKHIGIAPESDLIFISLLRTSASLIDAFNYIADYAASVNKPFVVNMSFGSHLGPHDGTLLENLAMDSIAGPGRIFVGSAGNNGSNAFHIKQIFNSPEDTLKTVIEFASYSQYDNLFGQAIAVWGSPNSSFSASLKIFETGLPLIDTEFFLTENNVSIDTLILINNDTIHLKLQAVAKNFVNNRPSMVFQISNKGRYPIALNIAGSTGEVHAWNVIRLNNRFTNWGMRFMNSIAVAGVLPGFSSGDIAYGLGEPAGVGKEVITVGAYNAERYTTSGAILNGNIAGFTSNGPTVDERIKPDITGPGVSVISAYNSYVPASGNTAASVEFEGRTYRFEGMSGTSMSGPAVAGMVALMLEANPQLTAQQAKEIIKNTARKDSHTGDIPSTGSNVWGWGKANALAAVASIADPVSIQTKLSRFNPFVIFPNPASGTINIESDETISSIAVFDISGKMVLERNVQSASVMTAVDLNDLKNGVYIIRINGKNNSGIARVIIQK